MSKRQFSMQAYWDAMAAELTPQLHFGAQGAADPGDFAAWHDAALQKLLELMGPFPAPVPPEAEVEYRVEEEDFFRERVVFDSEAYMSVPCQVLIPKHFGPDRSHPAILCCHGHGKFGKDPVAGLVSSAAHQADIDAMNYDYAAQLARAGFLTLAPDLRGFGERRDGDDYLGRDTCNVNFLKGGVMGLYPLTLNVWDMKCCVDYLCTRPEVDPNRIGMMGLSQGGTMTAFTAAVEPRIRAADIIAYVNPIARFGIHHGNFCGSQILPGLYRWLDAGDIAGLIAPRPLLMEMGTADACFYFQDLWKGYTETKAIYEAAGADSDLWTDIHPGPHAFSGRRAAAFFGKYL